ncbi:MAG: 4'-phosphopantetheinyl transferase superfamily protein [Bacteroidetes bacterium]|nr:4'-phosphopantetheinyl transferase superfamily protein [Bacteroidota bacterium]MBS1946686.1 4'-phosphopantetheinyl transferase superfamily protein [Bacteroidota bacterium]MBS1975217.1 4'-phosphopantetheinyl transferase superfamily protein [Bacteroidota bacterium]
MPLFYQHNINEHTRLAIWQIAEDEGFFLEKVPHHRDITHPHKRLQHLAGRYLLPLLFSDFPLEEIMIADTRKPFLPNEKYHFSISHCGQFAAAIASSKNRVGADIEMIATRIQRIAHKFLNETEKNFFNEDYKAFLDQWSLKDKVYTEYLTMMWSAKEAIYKWHGNGGVDFRKNIQLLKFTNINHEQEISLPFVFAKEDIVSLSVNTKIFDEMVLAWIIS